MPPRNTPPPIPPRVMPPPPRKPPPPIPPRVMPPPPRKPPPVDPPRVMPPPPRKPPPENPPRLILPPPRKPPPVDPPPPRRCATLTPAARLQHKAIRNTSLIWRVPLLGSLPPRRRRRNRVSVFSWKSLGGAGAFACQLIFSRLLTGCPLGPAPSGCRNRASHRAR